jgi:hypothetical protein
MKHLGSCFLGQYRLWVFVNDSSEDGETAEQGFAFANAGSGMLQELIVRRMI